MILIYDKLLNDEYNRFSNDFKKYKDSVNTQSNKKNRSFIKKKMSLKTILVTSLLINVFRK